MQDEELDTEKIIEGFKKIPPKYITAIIIVCLLFLFCYLSFIYGFNNAFRLQEDYYEEKITKFCICREEPHYNIPNKPLGILNFPKDKEK